MSAYGMMDRRCLCGKRYGWKGKIVDCPPCPKCGKKPDMDVLLKDQATVDAAIEEIKKFHAAKIKETP